MMNGPAGDTYQTFCIDWIKVNKADITQASVTLSDDIALNVYAQVSDRYYSQENMPQAEFSLNGETETVTGELQEGNLFKFTFTGITPQYMNAQVSVSLKVVKTAGYEVADTIESISVLSYCEALLASSAEDLGLTEAKFAAMQTLIADLLNYGAAAQTYTGVNTDDLVNADLGDVRRGSGGQRGAEAVYSEEGRRQVKETIGYYMGNARIMLDTLRQSGFEVYGGTNSPYLWLKAPEGTGSWEFFDTLLREVHVVGTPGVGFGPSGEGYLRLTSFGSREDCVEAMGRIAAWARK